MKRELLLLVGVTACYPSPENLPPCVGEACEPAPCAGTPCAAPDLVLFGPGPDDAASATTAPGEIEPGPVLEAPAGGAAPERFAFADHAPRLVIVDVAGPEGRAWPGAALELHAAGERQGHLHMGARGRRFVSVRLPVATAEVELGAAIAGVPSRWRVPLVDGAAQAHVGPTKDSGVGRDLAECFAHTFPEGRVRAQDDLRSAPDRLAAPGPLELRLVSAPEAVTLAFAVVDGAASPERWTPLTAAPREVALAPHERLVMAALDAATGAVVASTTPRSTDLRDAVFVLDPATSSALATFEIDGVFDLNDAVVRVTGAGLSGQGLPRLAPPRDADGDGVSDGDDAYPADAMRAGRLAFPGEQAWGTRLFDTAWPERGDRDFNDLVVGYRVTRVTEAGGAVTALELDVRVRAVGTASAPGLAWRLPVTPEVVASAEVVLPGRGSRVADRWPTERFTTTLFDDALAFMGESEGREINVARDGVRRDAGRVRVVVTFAHPVSLPPHEPFDLFVFDPARENWEVHAVDVAPTAHGVGWLGVAADDSDADTGRYYRDAGHEGWVIDLATSAPYPAAGCSLDEAYPSYPAWARSGGHAARDWLRARDAACALDLAR